MNRSEKDALVFYLDGLNASKRLSRNFLLREFASKCGSNQVIIHPALLDAIQQIRDAYGKPIKITSGYRTPSHNESVGGAENSLHTKGMALDIHGDDLDELERLCRDFGLVVRPYPNKRFIHIDVGVKRNW